MKKETKIIFPAQVELVRVTKQMLRDPNGRLWDPIAEHSARRMNATATLCSSCLNRLSEYKNGKCVYCRRAQEWHDYMQIQKTTSDFPIAHGDSFFWHEDELLEYCEENECAPGDLILYGTFRLPWKQLDSSYWEEQATEDGDLPEALEAAIKELNEKIANIPGYYYGDETVRYVHPQTKTDQ